MMRKLNRTSVAAPGCLASYKHGADNWESVESEHKAEIRKCLHVMQGQWCAYCEGALDVLGQHIEHFEPKSKRPQATFSWSNLFCSCQKLDSCGHFKDSGAGSYKQADLINPCSDDPDTYFRFRSDGTISLRRGLSEQQRTRAETTLRVFNLDPSHGRLRQMRKNATAGYVSLVDEAEGFTRDELGEFFAMELKAARDQQFQTAIRHVLTEP